MEGAANTNLFVSTTVHIPEPLLARVDARARARGVSRNRLVVEALEQSLGTGASWPAELLEMLRSPLDEGTKDALEQSLAQVRARRANRRRGRSPVR